MIKVLTDESNCNTDFHFKKKTDHSGDGHRQETVFDKGVFGKGLSKKSRDSEPKHSDLTRRRWRTPFPDRREQRQLIRDAKAGDERAKQKLLELFHRLVLKIANQYSGPTFGDLMAAGLLGLSEAIYRFNENRGNGLEAYAPYWIEKYIKLEVKRWSRDGAAGETRQDRFLYSNPNATAEEIVAAVGGSLIEAHRAIDRAEVSHEEYTEEGRKDSRTVDGDGWREAPEVAASHDMCRMYRCFSRYQLSPQLLIHEIVCGGKGRVGWIDECVLYHEAEDRRFLDRIGRSRYALWLLEREKSVASFYNKETRYRYRTKTPIHVRAGIAAQIRTPIFAQPLTFKRHRVFKTSLAVQMEEQRRSAILQNMQRLRALRSAQAPDPKPKRKRPWPDSQAAIQRAKSSHSHCPRPLPMLYEQFVKKNSFQSVIFAELHCSAI